MAIIDINGIAQRLRELREQHDYTQRFVARVLKVEQGSVCNWEHGRRIPTSEHVLMLAHLYNTDPNYILMGTKSKKKPKRVPFGALLDGDELLRISYGPGEDVTYEHVTAKS